MNNRDLQVIEKVSERFSDYEWKLLNSKEESFQAIQFPIDAEKVVNNFHAEVVKGMTVVVGAYQTRFYYEEDRYSWEKECYVAIIVTKQGVANCIAFITSKEIENKMNNLFINIKLNNFTKKNPIVKLYDDVNRKVSGIENLYDDFLGEDK
ncbi:hypothetical protein CSV67_05950 [Sporosarcina sp. P2]|uniref:hypothetical protein n=1 Tax=unclassified Sporosarcina TaxID=2647733 RepID=UPI000C173410|nr:MULTISPECIES: hypothetical protein [unclassified Sporosarcina]PIC69062.1 hypothetical protein CSV77_15670 [Sporosarcina sp. P16b]PID03008.1 hypothetical protein CSV67_05950 [Sporosarcina sp. P2]